MPSIDSWEAPGPGFWTIDKVHFMHPLSRIAEEASAYQMAGVRETLWRYGALIDGSENAPVNGLRYSKVIPLISVLDGESETSFRARAQKDPIVTERFANAEEAIATRRWRDELARWDNHIKPAIMAANLALGSIDPRGLEDTALRDHVQSCITHFLHTTRMHHVPNLTVAIPTGMLIAFIQEITSRAPTEAVSLVTGAYDASGPNSDAAIALREVARGSHAFMSWMASATPDEGFIQAIGEWPGEIGRAARRYIRHAGYLLGATSNLTEPCALERPEMFAMSIKAAVLHESQGHEPPNLEAWRDAVPETRWEEFVGLVEEARHVARLRDERGLFCNWPARGITRMSVLEMGRRLADRGRLEQPEHLFEASSSEMLALFDGEPGPSSTELADLFRWRERTSAATAPRTLGGPPPPPVPPDWLPRGAAQVARAQAANQQLANLGGPAAGVDVSSTRLEGVPAARGTYSGPAVVIHTIGELERVRPGDIVVAAATAASFNVVFPLVGAIVTDFGGELSHAAIMAREFGIPCVAGAGKATQVIQNGDIVTVDGYRGIVTITRQADD